MKNIEVEWGNGQGCIDDYANTGEQADAGTIHGKQLLDGRQDLLVRAPEEASDATFADEKED